MLNANIDAGLKFSMAMGYHEDPSTRTAFIQVLTNILNQGVEFDTLAENVTTSRYDKLLDVSYTKKEKCKQGKRIDLLLLDDCRF
jgi:neurofibromin 1